MSEFSTLLIPEGDAGNSLRTKNVPGQSFRQLLQDHGNHGDALIARATIVEVASGTLKPGGDLATIVVFEYQFISLDTSRRFTKAKITLEFNDANGSAALDPEVYKIAPEGVKALNKTTTSKDYKHTVNAGFSGGVPAASGNLGYQWELSTKFEKEYSARLVGVKKNMRLFGNENGVIWSLQENEHKKDGIPNFLRTAVILRRISDDPFQVTLDVHTEVDWKARVGKMFGKNKTEPVDPVDIDPKLTRVEADLKATEEQMKNLGELNMTKYAGVSFATLMDSAA